MPSNEKGAEARHDGNVDAAMAKAAKVIEATYDVPIIAHAPMEPLNAIAHVQADRVDVWVGTQNADAALTFAAQASGMKPENVYIHNTFSGGGFGRRLGPDEVAQAVAVSKAVGKPVKLVWTREEEIRQGRYRTQAAIRFKAGFAADGTPIALDMRNSAGSANPAAVKDGLDAQTMQGLINTAYKLPNLPRHLDPQEHACAAWPVARAGPFAERVLHGKLRRRNGVRGRQGPGAVPARAAGASSRLPAGDRCAGREGRLGQADASRQRARRRRARELRLHRRHDRRSCGDERRRSRSSAWSSPATAARSSTRAASRPNSKAA